GLPASAAIDDNSSTLARGDCLVRQIVERIRAGLTTWIPGWRLATRGITARRLSRTARAGAAGALRRYVARPTVRRVSPRTCTVFHEPVAQLGAALAGSSAGPKPS